MIVMGQTSLMCHLRRMSFTKGKCRGEDSTARSLSRNRDHCRVLNLVRPRYLRHSVANIAERKSLGVRGWSTERAYMQAAGTGSGSTAQLCV